MVKRIRLILLTSVVAAVLCACTSVEPAGSVSPAAKAPTTGVNSAPTSARAADFCAALRSFADAQRTALASGLTNASDPRAASTLREQAGRVERSVPAELSGDWQALRPAIDIIADQLLSPRADFSSAMEKLRKEEAVYVPALRLIAYARDTCGFDMSDIFGTWM